MSQQYKPYWYSFLIIGICAVGFYFQMKFLFGEHSLADFLSGMACTVGVIGMERVVNRR